MTIVLVAVCGDLPGTNGIGLPRTLGSLSTGLTMKLRFACF